MTEKNIPKTGYKYEVFTCKDGADVQKVYDWGRMKEGFYPYLIPQAEGCIIVAAYADPLWNEQRKQPKIVHGLKPLSEADSRKLIPEIIICHPESQLYDTLDGFLTLLYDKGYEVCKKIDKKEA